MDYQTLFNALQSSTLFDLWRLNCALDHFLDDPQRLEGIKRQLNIGMTISYFERKENRLIDAQILDIRRTRATVRNLHDQKRWTIPFYMINLEDIPVDISPSAARKQIDRATLKVGDRVGWLGKSGEECYGIVNKLNPKKAVIELNSGEQWRIPYALLFSVLDGELRDNREGLMQYSLLPEQEDVTEAILADDNTAATEVGVITRESPRDGSKLHLQFEQNNHKSAKQTPSDSVTSKTGRNHPCPCGSGKKYKRCCLRKDNDRQSATFPAQH